MDKTTPAPMSVKEKIAAAQKARDAAKLSDTDAADLKEREELQQAIAEQADAEAKKRDLELLKRLGAAQELHGADRVRAVAIKGSPHTFIVKGNQQAHATWETKWQKSLMDKKVNKAEIDREYALASIIDWNGKTGFETDSVSGYELRRFLEANPGFITPLSSACMLLNGFIAEEAKS